MAKRVQQADGSYCYTEDCRIHDRSSDSTGLKAIVNDVEVSLAQIFAQETSQALQKHLQVSEEVANRIAERVIDDVIRKDSGSTAYDFANSISLSSKEEGIALTPTDNLNASYEAYNTIIQKSLIRKGDEVILNKTGERGTIVEGSSAFGGAVRFNPENFRSRNSFAWFQASEVTKLEANDNSLAREKIIAASRSTLISTSVIKQLLDEESSPTTRNAQGTKEFGSQAKAARANLLEIGDRIHDRYGLRDGMTKENVVLILNREYEMPMNASISDAELKATKSGLHNIITYLDPTASHRTLY